MFDLFTQSSKESPIIIGATGGSGTRLVHQILESAGAHMGVNYCPETRDARDTGELFATLIPEVLQATPHLHYRAGHVTPKQWKMWKLRLSNAIAHTKGRAPKNAKHWGFKNPRSIYLLPLLHAIYPRMRFVHVTRDGRDMAYSENQRQAEAFFQLVFGRDYHHPNPQDTLELWAKVNANAANFGRDMLGKQYMHLSYDALCQNPKDIIQKVLGFARLDVSEARVNELSELIQPPASIGRWKEQQHTHPLTFDGHIAEALRVFGYDT